MENEIVATAHARPKCKMRVWSRLLRHHPCRKKVIYEKKGIYDAAPVFRLGPPSALAEAARGGGDLPTRLQVLALAQLLGDAEQPLAAISLLPHVLGRDAGRDP